IIWLSWVSCSFALLVPCARAQGPVSTSGPMGPPYSGAPFQTGPGPGTVFPDDPPAHRPPEQATWTLPLFCDDQREIHFFTPPILGDQLSPPYSFPTTASPTTQTAARSAFTPGRILLPSIRGFKIAEDESPRPLDRAYFTANYYSDVDKA